MTPENKLASGHQIERVARNRPWLGSALRFPSASIVVISFLTKVYLLTEQVRCVQRAVTWRRHVVRRSLASRRPLDLHRNPVRRSYVVAGLNPQRIILSIIRRPIARRFEARCIHSLLNFNDVQFIGWNCKRFRRLKFELSPKKKNFSALIAEFNTKCDLKETLYAYMSRDKLVEFWQSFKTAKRSQWTPQAPGDATLLKRVFRDNFVIFSS